MKPCRCPSCKRLSTGDWELWTWRNWNAARPCLRHPVGSCLPPHARSALLARCNGHWKQVLYFLECLLRMPGPSAPANTHSKVSACFFSLQFLTNLVPFLDSVLVEHLYVVQSYKCLGMESQVVAMAGTFHTLIVNGIGELYITSRANYLPTIYRNIPPEPQSNLRLIFLPPIANCI